MLLAGSQYLDMEFISVLLSPLDFTVMWRFWWRFLTYDLSAWLRHQMTLGNTLSPL